MAETGYATEANADNMPNATDSKDLPRRPSIKRSLAYVFGGRFMRAFIQILTAAAIARLLTPQEMGIFAVASATIAISMALAEFGIHPYIVQVNQLSKDVVQRAFGVMVLINWVLAGGLFLGRSAIGAFYQNPQIEAVIAVLAVTFLLNPFVTVGLALVMRELRYGKLTILNVSTGAIGSIASVTLAFLDFGAISLAYGAVVTKIGMFFGVIILRPKHLSFRPQFRRLGEIASFGSWAISAALVRSAGNQSPELIIGRSLGLDAAGLFDRGMTVTRLINQQITGSLSTVLTPFFAEEGRSKLDLKERFIVRLQITSGVIWPLMIVLSGCSYSLILFLFGPQWTAAAPVAGVLAITATLLMPFNVGRQYLMSQGKVQATFFIETFTQAARIVGILIFARDGLVAIAAVLLAPSLVFIGLIIRQVGSALNMKWSDWSRAVVPSVATSGIVAVIVAAEIIIFGYAPEGLPIFNLAICGSIGFAGWLLSLWLARHPVRFEISDLCRRGLVPFKSRFFRK